MKPAEPTRTLIATDVRLYAEGLEIALRSRAEIDVVGSASLAGEVMAAISELAPEVLLLDPAIPDAAALTRAIFESPLQTKVIVLGLAEVETEVLEWVEFGIAGFVTRANSLDQVAVTIRGVARDEWICSPTIMSALLRHLAQLAHERSYGDKPAHLTCREYDVAHLLAHGLSNKQIALELSISVATAKNHVHNILAKLHLQSRGEAAAWARVHTLPRRRRSSRAEPSKG